MKPADTPSTRPEPAADSRAQAMQAAASDVPSDTTATTLAAQLPATTAAASKANMAGEQVKDQKRVGAHADKTLAASTDDATGTANTEQQLPAATTMQAAAPESEPTGGARTVERSGAQVHAADSGKADRGSSPDGAVTGTATDTAMGTSSDQASTAQTAQTAQTDLQPASFQLPVVAQATAAVDTATPAASTVGTETEASASSDETLPAAQLASPVVSLLQAQDGSSRMSVSLHPKELGQVTIKLDRDAGGAVRIVVAATEPGTLRSLMAEQSHLHAALDAASLPAGDRQFSFELAAGTSTENSQDATASGGGEQRQSGQRSDGQGQGQGETSQGSATSATSGTDTDARSTSIPGFLTTQRNVYRAGVNITA